jgi:hypothetical protein
MLKHCYITQKLLQWFCWDCLGMVQLLWTSNSCWIVQLMIYVHAFIDPNCGTRFISTENILWRFNTFLHKFCSLRKTFIEKFKISENNISSVEAAKAVWYWVLEGLESIRLSVNKTLAFTFPHAFTFASPHDLSMPSPPSHQKKPASHFALSQHHPHHSRQYH